MCVAVFIGRVTCVPAKAPGEGGNDVLQLRARDNISVPLT